MTTLYQLFQKVEEEDTLPKSFYEASVTRISKPDKDITGKQNYKPMSLKSIDVGPQQNISYIAIQMSYVKERRTVVFYL